MKKIIIVLFVLLNTGYIFSQTEKIGKGNKEIGLNATYLARNFFGADDDITSIDDYLIYLKLIGGKNAFRFGLGGTINRKVEDVNGIDRETLASKVDVRIGYERRNRLGKSWIYYYGFDAVGHYDQMELRTVTNIDDVTSADRYTEIGGGPIMGIQFMINENIGISTETALLYVFSSFSSDDTFVNFPEINESRQFDEFRITAIAPTNVYISVKF